MTDSTRFPFAFTAAYRRAGRPFGVTPARAWVDVGATELHARFGRWRLTTPLANITRTTVTGPYAFLKTAGPAHLGWTDLGLTFATNGDRGLLICFRDRVPGMDPFGVLRHGELTVTVEDVDGLAALLAELVPG